MAFGFLDPYDMQAFGGSWDLPPETFGPALTDPNMFTAGTAEAPGAATPSAHDVAAGASGVADAERAKGTPERSWFDRSMLGRISQGESLTTEQIKNLQQLQRSLGGTAAGGLGSGGLGGSRAGGAGAQQWPMVSPPAANYGQTPGVGGLLSNILQQRQNMIAQARVPVRPSLLG